MWESKEGRGAAKCPVHPQSERGSKGGEAEEDGSEKELGKVGEERAGHGALGGSFVAFTPHLSPPG